MASDIPDGTKVMVGAVLIGTLVWSVWKVTALIWWLLTWPAIALGRRVWHMLYPPSLHSGKQSSSLFRDTQYAQGSHGTNNHRKGYYKGRRVNYSNPRNNHDHLKKMHASLEDAELEIGRMKWLGLPGSDRLNAYYNAHLGGWFVGRSR